MHPPEDMMQSVHNADAGPPAFSAATRRHNLIRLDQEHLDMLVIGGGITGAAIARHAAHRGYRVALVEKGDFAGGTSGKSSKLVHGGLRYLEALDLGLVLRACHQRRMLLQCAPHLVWPLPFVMPIYRDHPPSRWEIRAALWLYDALAAFHSVQPPGVASHRVWPASQALAREPLLNPRGLVEAACYYDCATDDARLTLCTLLDAHRAGATIANYAEVTGLLRTKNRIAGAWVYDRQEGREIAVRARVCVSAAGPWTDALLGRTGTSFQRWLRPTKGVHIVVPRQRAPTQSAITFTAPHDGRFMFLVPWNTHTLIGTTDTDYEGDLDQVLATPEDVAYILEAAQHAFPAAHLGESDVISTYASLRPLVREDSASSYWTSRQHRAWEVAPGLIAIAGGKLTTHRLMAQETVDMAARTLAREHRVYPRSPRNTFGRDEGHAPLPGGDVESWSRYQDQQRAEIVDQAGLPDEIAAHLVSTYGSQIPRVLELLEDEPALAERIVPDLPVIQAQAIYAVRHEMALTLEDVLERRTHVLNLASGQGTGATGSVADLMAAELGWTPHERAAQLARYQHQVALNRRWRGGERETPCEIPSRSHLPSWS